VLDGHVREQVDEVPARAWRRKVEVFGSNGVDDVDRREHGDPIQWKQRI
jgi:hypothetical protein